MSEDHKLQEYKKDRLKKLAKVMEVREAASVVDLIMEHVLAKSRAEILLQTDISQDQAQKIDEHINKVYDGMPVQYALQEAHFFGRKFFVDERVLIPRQETEELVKWIIDSTENGYRSILEIGTGSACISLTLAKENLSSKIIATDISEDAISVALKNQERFRTAVEFLLIDVFDEKKMNSLSGDFDIIVSNPPYVPVEELDFLPKNVVDHEPHVALFSGEDTLYYYRRICKYGYKNLRNNGFLYFEIHEDYASDVKELMESAGFVNVALKKDIHERYRMIRGQFIA